MPKPTDDMLSVEDSICKLLEVSLRLQFAVECEAKDADFLRRGYSHPIDNYWVRRVCNASVEDAQPREHGKATNTQELQV